MKHLRSKQTREEAIARAREMSEQALRTARQRSERLLEHLQATNERLILLREHIRDEQPKRHGAVLLELQACGPGCIGCPHPRWQRWINQASSKKGKEPTWYATRPRYPSHAARAKEVPESAREYIREATRIIQRRETVIRRLRELHTCVANLDTSYAIHSRQDDSGDDDA